LGAGAGVEPIAPGITQKIEGKHGGHDGEGGKDDHVRASKRQAGVTKWQRQIPHTASRVRDDKARVWMTVFSSNWGELRSSEDPSGGAWSTDKAKAADPSPPSPQTGAGFGMTVVGRRYGTAEAVP
jgi:hypothetical protein